MFYISLVSTILWFLFMTCLSHQDGEHTGRASRELAEHLRFLDNDINDLNGKLRRAAHIVVFAVFTFLLGLTLKIGGASLEWMITAALWSYVDEATKPWIQGRHFSWFDVGLNLIGAFIGGAVANIPYINAAVRTAVDLLIFALVRAVVVTAREK